MKNIIQRKHINIILSLLFLLTFYGCEENNMKIDKPLYFFNITFEDSIIPIHQKIPMRLYDEEDSEQILYEGTIERRGGGSIRLPKHSYEIDLNEDKALGNLPADDDWILNASYIDKTFLRHVLCYELFSLMGEHNIVSNNKYVELKLNGEYNGLYILMEKLDKSSLDIETSDSFAMIFKEPHIFRATYDGIISQYPDNFHQQTYPKIEDEDKRTYLENIREFILTSSDNEFEKGISDIFDMENIIDWHLLLLMTNNSDGILKNFYLYKKNKETPIRIAPWDYDHSFGRDGDNEMNLDERPLNVKRSILFKRLLEFDGYKKKLKEKWLKLNQENLFSVNGLKQRILKKSKFVKDLAKKNAERWPLDSSFYYDDNDFEEEIDIMFQYIDIRHKRLTRYFNNL